MKSALRSPDPALFEPPVEALTPDMAKAQHARLVAIVAEADEAYHNADQPFLSDADYDRLKRRAEAIEAAFPALQAGGVSGRGGAKPSGLSLIPL